MNHPFYPDPKDPMKVKRNMAIISMGMIFSVVLGVFWLIKTGDSTTAAMLTAGSGIIIIALPTLATPIVQYFYMTGDKKNASSDSDSVS